MIIIFCFIESYPNCPQRLTMRCSELASCVFFTSLVFMLFLVLLRVFSRRVGELFGSGTFYSDAHAPLPVIPVVAGFTAPESLSAVEHEP
jgi:hypothetical protein